MRNDRIAWIGVALVALVACEQPVSHNSSSGSTFNIVAYVQHEVQRLQSVKPEVLKSVETEQEATETIQTNNIDWEEELTVFEQADINKPTLREYYTLEEKTLPEGGKSQLYLKKEDAEAPIERLYLHISPDNKLQRLEATLLDKNLLFFSKRKAVLEADPQNGHLESYSIHGVQKLIFGDSLHYSIKANL